MVKIKEIDFNSTDADKETFIKAYIDIFNSPDNLKYLSFTGILFTQEMITSWLNRLNEKSEIRYRIAVYENRIVGISVIKENSLTGFELLGLAVHPEFKRKGIGTKLLNDCIECSDEFKSIDAIVFTDNKPMLLLLIKNDFEPITMKNEFRYDGTNTLLLRRYKK